MGFEGKNNPLVLVCIIKLCCVLHSRDLLCFVPTFMLLTSNFSLTNVFLFDCYMLVA